MAKLTFNWLLVSGLSGEAGLGENAGETFSFPNHMIWEFFQSLTTQVQELNKITDRVLVRQRVSVCILLSIATLEAFFNTYFRMLIEEPEYKRHKERILSDIKNKVCLADKVKKWPKDIFCLEKGINDKLFVSAQ